MDFKDIEEAVLNTLNITSKLKDPELTTAIQSILDKCVAYREEQNLEAPGILNKDDPAGEDLLETDDWKQSPYYPKAAHQMKGWHSEADVHNLARQLRDADKKPIDDEDHFEVPRAGSPEHLALIEKQNPGTLEKWASNKMKEAAKHFGEEQAEGLDNLLEGLRDTPHDNRW